MNALLEVLVLVVVILALVCGYIAGLYDERHRWRAREVHQPISNLANTRSERDASGLSQSELWGVRPESVEPKESNECVRCGHHERDHRGNGACMVIVRGHVGQNEICPCNELELERRRA